MLRDYLDYVPVAEPYRFALLAGLLLALSFPPYHLVFLLPVAFGLFPWVLEGLSTRERIRSAAITGFVFYALHVYWFTQFHALAFPGVLIVLTAYFSLWGYLLSRVGVNAWTVAGGWILLEIITGSGPLAFPWSRVATALSIHHGLVQPVRWLGELAWGGLIVFASYSTGEAIRNGSLPWRTIGSVSLAGLLLVAGFLRIGRTRLESYDEPVLLVQPDVISSFDAADQTGQQLGNLVRLTRKHARSGDLVVWPETSLLRFPFEFTGPGDELVYRDRFHERRIRGYVEGRFHLLSGTRFYDPRPEALDYLNGAVLIEPSGRPAGVYTKRIMVPFGETIPGMGKYEWITAFGRMVGTLGYRSGDRGGLIELPFGSSTVKAGVLICYEDAFPAYVHGQVKRGADLLINISNDSWSQSSAAHWQHFYRARLRAIETGRTVLRNGNTGVSAVIDPLGRSHSRLDPFRKGVVRERPLKPLGMSYIVKWNFWVSVAVSVLLLGVGITRYRV